MVHGGQGGNDRCGIDFDVDGLCRGGCRGGGDV